MALVHSSWHGHARRLLGYSAITLKGPAPNLLRNHFYGGWTRQLYLSYGGQMHSFMAPNQPYDYFLTTFCARIPSTHLVSFSFYNIRKLSPTFIATLCEALSALPSLEDLTIQVESHRSAERIPLYLIPALSEARLPSLCALRFIYERWGGVSEIIHQHSLLLPLARIISRGKVTVQPSQGPRIGARTLNDMCVPGSVFRISKGVRQSVQECIFE